MAYSILYFRYRLAGTTRYGQSHYTAELIIDGEGYKYDGLHKKPHIRIINEAMKGFANVC